MFEIILEKYSILLKKVNKLEKGYASNKWIITDQLNNKYILKEIVKQDYKRLNFILSVQSKMSNIAPKIILTKSNDLFCEYDGNLYYISEYLQNYINAKMDSYNIGLFLGKIHALMSSIASLEENKFLKISDNQKKIIKLSNFYNNIGDQIYINMIDKKIQILDTISETKINLQKLEYQIVHGDYYLDNIMEYNGDFKILDFDQCCHFYKGYEILRGMFMTCLDLNNSDKVIFKNMQEYMNGYKQVNSLKNPEEAYNLYLYIQANSLSGLKEKEYGNSDRLSFAIKRDKILDFLYENKNQIIKILGDDQNETTYSSTSITLQKHR